MGEKCDDFLDWLAGYDVAMSSGIYVSLNLGNISLAVTLELAIDSELNIQVNGTLSLELSSSAAPSISVGTSQSVFFVPDVSYLEGETCYAGGSVTVPLPATPVAISGGLNAGQTVDGYWGGTMAVGVTPATKMGVEAHTGKARSWRLSPQYNLRTSLW